jgi:hypothetical protein
LDTAPKESGAAMPKIFSMTRATALSPSRFLLLPEAGRPERDTDDRVVRRYRLARLKLDSRDPKDRFAHLRRTYD